MIGVKNVSKKYGKFLANDHISFDVQDGQIAILMGPNGAGKSTIIKNIVGLLRFQGEILLDGHENKSLEAKKLLGYVPEMPAVYDLLTVNEHLEFIARAYKLENWEDKAEKLLTKFELLDKKNKLGKELSKGMQQKVSVVCQLLHNPRIVIFDEPMIGLDPHAIKELKKIFKELKEDGCSVLISTHMIDSVEDYWDVVHIMMNGKIKATRINNRDKNDVEEKSLEDLFFEITEGKSNSTEEKSLKDLSSKIFDGKNNNENATEKLKSLNKADDIPVKEEE